MNDNQRRQAAAEAQARIATGECPQGLVHVLFFPPDCSWAEEEIQGLSTALPAEADLSGYTGRYFTLAELAA